MEWGLLNKIWAKANIWYSVIVFFSLEDIGCCYKCRFVKHEPLSLCHNTTKVFLTALFSGIAIAKKTGRERSQIWQSWHQAATHYFIRRLFWTNNQICYPFRYALVWCYFSESFPSYDVLFQLWPNLRPSSSDHRMEQTWYILMRRSGLTNEATVRQNHLCVKETQ